MPAQNCPARETLIGFAIGDLPEEQIESVADHLESCRDCEDTVALFESQPDTFIGKLRTPNVHAQFADEQEFQAAVAGAGALVSEPAPNDESNHGHVPQLEQLKEYRLLEKLGEGGMGTVYKALQTRLNRVVALKMLPADRVAHGPSVARFAREIEAVGKLDHPNIVRAFDAGEDDEMHYLVMELVDGVDLHRLVKQIGPLSVADACEIVRQAAMGLQHAHQHGLVHRDVKPSNLLLSRDGTVKVLDLGLALLQGESRRREDLTATGQVMGTLDYIAPEQASDSHLVDIRADVYALGCTLFKLLTGRAPFAGAQHDSALKKLMAHAQTPPPALKDHRAEVPDGLAELLQRLLAKHPDERPATPAAVATALEPYASDADLPALASHAEDLPQHEAPAASADEIPVMLNAAGHGSGGAPQSGDREPGRWLWVGWALVATAFGCLGMTIASMTAAYELSAATGGPASGLADGVSGSLRYMTVGGPAFLIGVVVLIVAYVHRFATQTKTTDRKTPWPSIAGITVVLLIAGMALGQVVIRIRHPDGRSTAVAVPDGSRVNVDDQGNVDVALPAAASLQPQPTETAEISRHGEGVSPDGSMIVYAGPDEDGDTEIFVARRDGTEPRQLTNNDSIDCQPDWSPDGRQIAFASTREGTWQVYVMDRDGGNIKNVSQQSINAHRPKFGPQGRVAFVSYERDYGKFQEVDLKLTVPGQPETVIASDAAITEFAWHPDGSILVYATSETPDAPGRLAFYRPADGTTKVVLYTDIDKRLQRHAANTLRWHMKTNTVQAAGQSFQMDDKADWVTCRIIPWRPGPIGVHGFGDNEVFFISPDGKARWVSLETSAAALGNPGRAGQTDATSWRITRQHVLDRFQMSGDWVASGTQLVWTDRGPVAITIRGRGKQQTIDVWHRDKPGRWSRSARVALSNPYVFPLGGELAVIGYEPTTVPGGLMNRRGSPLRFLSLNDGVQPINAEIYRPAEGRHAWLLSCEDDGDPITVSLMIDKQSNAIPPAEVAEFVVVQSADRGRTWQVVSSQRPKTKGVNLDLIMGNHGPGCLSLPFTTAHFGRFHSVFLIKQLGFLRTRDGGATWKNEIVTLQDTFPAATQRLPLWSANLPGGVAMIYLAHDDDNARYFLTQSSDQGVTWRESKPLSPDLRYRQRLRWSYVADQLGTSLVFGYSEYESEDATTPSSTVCKISHDQGNSWQSLALAADVAISPAISFALSPNGNELLVARETWKKVDDKTETELTITTCAPPTRHQTQPPLSRLDGTWRLDPSSDANGDGDDDDNDAGTRPDLIIDINPDVTAKIPQDFKDKLAERGVTILTTGHMTYQRKEQLFAIADWNDQLMLIAFDAAAPHHEAGDAMIRFEPAPQQQDDQLFISEAYEDNEPFLLYKRLTSN